MRTGAGRRPAGRPEDGSLARVVGSKAAFRFMEAHQEEHDVVDMARVLGVSRSGYYAWKARPRSARARLDGILKKEIGKIHSRHRGAYGAPRMMVELRERGWGIGRKRVARLMRELGIRGRVGNPGRTPKT